MKRSELPEYARNLPRYNPDEVCAQCGFDRVKDVFRERGSGLRYVMTGSQSYLIENEEISKIHRTCLRCGATWEVLPLSIEDDA